MQDQLVQTGWGVYTPNGLLGDQEPPIRIQPKGREIFRHEIVELAEICGFELYPWQVNVLAAMLSVNDRDMWAAKEFGLVVARQNGKSVIAEMRVLAGLFLVGEKSIIYSAHRSDASITTFRRIAELIENTPELMARTKAISRTTGREAIRLYTGEEVSFRTRTEKGGRGLSAECIIFDEALVLTNSFAASLIPSMAAQPNPQTVYMSSAGDAKSEVLGALRYRALNGNVDSLGYWEWSADLCTDYCDESCEDHDDYWSPEVLAKTNPSYGRQGSHEFFAHLRDTMPEEKFKREFLSVADWPTPTGDHAIIPKETWEDRASETVEQQGKMVFSLTTTPDGMTSCIVVAGFTDADKKELCVEITAKDGYLDHREGNSWVIPRVVELQRKWKPACWIIDHVGQSSSFTEPLKKEIPGIKIESPRARDVAVACTEFLIAVSGTKTDDPYVYHRDQVEMNLAVATAEKRKLAGLWAWGHSVPGIDIIALEAATLAMWGLKKQALKKRELWVFRG